MTLAAHNSRSLLSLTWVLREYTRQLSPPHPRRSTTPWLGTLPAFTHLATKRRSLPKGKTATHPVEFLRQLNSVSRTTYILTISHGHIWCLPHPLSRIKTVTSSFTDRHKVQNQPTNSHDTPAFIKPIRRYFPPHHSSHQPNPLQHREQTHHQQEMHT